MIKRTCPACGAIRYSADDSGTWVCECGRRLTPELNEAPERKTDTEKAMAHFEALQKRYTTQHNGKQCELVATALSALREKEAREKGCEYCNGEYNTEIKAQYIRWHTPNDGTKHDMKVKCCPHCGRELPKEEK